MAETKKNAAAVRLGKLRAQSMTAEEWKTHGERYGPAGGAARAAALTPEQRSAIAKKAAEQMWAKKRAAGAVKKTGKKKAGGPGTDGLSRD